MKWNEGSGKGQRCKSAQCYLCVPVQGEDESESEREPSDTWRLDLAAVDQAPSVGPSSFLAARV